ncbi:hypothetical protein P152DRAFT_517962 [Eremomyces bilateralis CBS 781.70]|uniref:Uncharacterized protein n=1 Tax=Eremomyces bilateralis CBS 781.70 TaxID=1392243 RepID=A0A6G1FQH4_9PEZI|nr:uncharacterized protein P152DRAFT_517962 [Eremomyces bilateralis CBS 781.70]KAF1807902.1 hypothetical protein P152DRAFT_517962 [Eremomyces bilateralis CBS 781.70]
MSRLPSLSNIIHIRDFIDAVTDDPTREVSPNHVEIYTDVNIFCEDNFYTPDIIVEPIRARIRAYLTRDQREQFVPNAFLYADGRFFTTQSPDNTLELSVQALSLMRHPGNVADFEEYRQRLPEQWCPMVTVVGSVPSRNDHSLDTAHARYFMIETSVYDVSKSTSVPSTMACFFEDSKRWQKVKTPQAGSFLSLTAKVAGRTSDTNLLALRVLDLAFLPKPTSTGLTPTPITTPSSKRLDRWEGRPALSTPSKKPRLLDPAIEILTPSDSTPRGLDRPHTDRTTDSQPTPSSLSTTTQLDDSSNISNPPRSSDSGFRPRRNCRPSKKLEVPVETKNSSLMDIESVDPEL